MLKGYYIFIIIICLSTLSCHNNSSNTISLKGSWSYKLDPENIGVEEQWHLNSFSAPSIILPSALRDAGIGNTPSLETDWTGSIYDSTWYFNPEMEKYRQKGDLKFPFWLTPVKQYKGVSWFQRTIEFPKAWNGKKIRIHLERPHWQTQVWIDSIYLGSDNSLSVPHSFLSPSKIDSGIHTLTVRVDNAIRDLDIGINSHSISDHTQGNWNGIVGDMFVEVVNQVEIQQVKVRSNIKDKSILVETVLDNPSNSDLTLNFKVKGVNHSHRIETRKELISGGVQKLETRLFLGQNAKLWSEFSPNLYQIQVQVENNNEILDSSETLFGLREFSIHDKQFQINDIPINLRGTTECSVFPLTGYPPTDEASWARIFEINKSFGLNHMRFHSYCPPEAAFIAADKAGFYLQVEGPSWAKYSVSLGRGLPIDAYLMEETKRIIDTYGNHPSFCMMAYGNEPSGNYVPYLENWVEEFKEFDPERVFTGASTGRSWAIIENSDFIVRSPPRGLEWKNKQPNSDFDYRNKTENQQRPYITFEMGQWCVYPNFDEIKKYTGSLKAKNFELFQEDLKDKGMSDLANKFLMASGKLQASCYKQEIEATLRTPNLAGFQLLSLNDFSGQGTALVGVLDAFWDEKGYITAEEFRSFCNEVVPLVRLPKFTFSSDEKLNTVVEVANFSGQPLNLPSYWELQNKSNEVLVSGKLSNSKIPLGNGNIIGAIDLNLDFIKKPTQLELHVNVGPYNNSWNIWVYPSTSKIEEPNEIHITKILDKKTIDILEKGGKVLLLAAGKVENGKEVVHHQTPVFWNTSWFKMRPPHTTGMLIYENHPVFADFPTEDFADLQWWEVANRQQIMNLTYFPDGFSPIVQPIDTWFLNRKLAMLFEARVGKGRLMVSSIDFKLDSQNIVSRQLYNSMLKYIKSDQFNPIDEVSMDILLELFQQKDRPVWNAYVSDNP